MGVGFFVTHSQHSAYLSIWQHCPDMLFLLLLPLLLLLLLLCHLSCLRA
jgi:hypothetical protein